MDPWSVEFVTPSDTLIAKFATWDKTKSNASKRRSFNRARKWISDLLKRPFNIPENEKLRHIDTTKAFEDIINEMTMLGGKTYEEHLRSCLAPLPIQHKSVASVKDLSENINDEEHFLDSEDEKSSDQENTDLNKHVVTVLDGKTSLKCKVSDLVFH